MLNKNSNFLSAVCFLVLAQTMVGINIVGSKYLISFIPVLWLLTLRFCLATLFLSSTHALAPVKKNNIGYYFSQLTRKDWIFIIAQALCAGLLFNCLMLLGLRYTDANIAGIITSALPAIIALVSWVFLRENLAGKKGLCICFATVGLMIIAFDKFNKNLPHSIIGDLLVFLSLIPEASYYVLSKHHPNRLPVFLISAIMNGINAVLLLPLALFFIDWHQVQLSGFGWLILLVVSISSALFYVFWYLGSHKVDRTMASLSTAVMPIATVLIAWLTLGEKIDVIQFTGMGFVIVSILIYAIA